jgi:hypothetical protein
MTHNVFTHSVGHGITEADACLYNEYSVFEMLQLRKVAASAVRTQCATRQAKASAPQGDKSDMREPKAEHQGNPVANKISNNIFKF